MSTIGDGEAPLLGHRGKVYHTSISSLISLLEEACKVCGPYVVTIHLSNGIPIYIYIRHPMAISHSWSPIFEQYYMAT